PSFCCSLSAHRSRSFFFTSTASPQFYTLSLHDALPISFDYEGTAFNLLDTPGHEDFSEDTYRTLTAVDSAIMVIDAAKGIEAQRSEEHTSELQSQSNLVCRLLLEKKKESSRPATYTRTT